MTKLLMILCMALAVSAVVGGEYTIDLPEGGLNGRVVAIQLSGKVLRNLGGHPAWLRLYDSSGKIVPWAREQDTVKTTNTSYAETPMTIDLVRKNAEGNLEISFHTAPEAALPDEAYLSFKTDVRDFGQNVKIYGKEAGGEEHPLKIHGTGYIFDSTSNIDVRATEVKFTPGQCREFRVVLSEANLERINSERTLSVTKGGKDGETTNEKMTVVDQPFNIKNLVLKSIQTNEEVLCGQLQNVPIPFEIVSLADGKSIYNVKPDVFPVKGLSFEFQEENYSRKYTVKNYLTDGMERTVGNGVVRRWSIGDGEKRAIRDSSRCTSFASDVTEGTLQITFEDNDNSPLTVKTVYLEIPLYYLKVIVEPTQFPLRLTAVPNSKEPVYDTASILALGGNSLNTICIHPELFSGEQIVAAEKKSVGMPRWLLYIAIGLAVVAMTTALSSTLKKERQN